MPLVFRKRGKKVKQRDDLLLVEVRKCRVSGDRNFGNETKSWKVKASKKLIKRKKTRKKGIQDKTEET